MSAADAVIVVVGLDEDDEGEGMIAAGDRVDLHLRAALEALREEREGSEVGRVDVGAAEGGGAVVGQDDVELARQLQSVLHSGVFRVYTNTDVVGCELGGALKNVIAIAILILFVIYHLHAYRIHTYIKQ